jgi:riboflavin synthase
MFSGLVECVGTVIGTVAVPNGVRLEVSTPWQADVSPGESVAVNGVCLTVVDVAGGRLAMDVGPETLRVTTLGALVTGRRLNLERALRTGDRIGGHFVQGHVDGVGTVLDVRRAAEFTWMAFSYPRQHEAWIIPKGAIAVDGISLTVATLGSAEFAVQIVPFTWANTNLSELRPGDGVNLEFDMLGKYAVRAVQLAQGTIPAPAGPPLT